MAVHSGRIQSYTNTEPQKRVVTDRILMADPMSIAGINALGLHNESKFVFANAPGKKYEWLEDTYMPRVDTCVESLSSSSSVTIFTVSNGSYFQIGDVIQVDDEYMLVTDVSSSTLTVTRGYGGNNTTHADTSSIYIRMSNRIEGAAAGDSGSTLITTGYNYTAILQRSIEVTRTDARLKQYGIPNIVEREIDKRMDELMMLLNLGLYHGVRQVGSSTTPRGFGGLDTFITTNPTALSSAALTQKNIEDELQACFDAGGAPSLIFLNSWAKRKITDFYAGYVRTERSETMGGITIDRILMPLGLEVQLVLDRHCPTNELWIIDPRYVGYITLDDFFVEELAKTRDTAYFGQVVGEYGLVVAFEKAHSGLTGFSITA